MYQSKRPYWRRFPRTVGLVGVGGRTTCAIGLAEALRQLGVAVLVLDTTGNRDAQRWADFAAWKVPVVAAPLSDLHNAVLDAERSRISTVIIDTPALTRDLNGIELLLSEVTDVLLTMTPSPMDASKIEPLLSLLFPRRAPLEKDGGFRTQVLPNQARGAATQTRDLLDPNREFTVPVGPAIPHRETYAQAFGDSPEKMVDGPFHALAASLLGCWASLIQIQDPAPTLPAATADRFGETAPLPHPR